MSEDLRHKILGLKDCNSVEYFVPEWEEKVHIKVWNVAERYKAISLLFDEKDPNKLGINYAKVIIMTLLDALGNYIFKDTDLEDILKKNSKAVELIVKEAIKVNSIKND